VKPVAWIKVRELTAMKAVAEYSVTAWKTNLGLVPEPDDEGLYTETQVQQLRESFEQSVTDPKNQPSQYGTVPMDWHDRDTALLRQALEALEWCEPAGTVGHGGVEARKQTIAALKERLK
jgi:hypothetical protein